MNEHRISAPLELHEVLNKYYGAHFVFRGIKDSSFALSTKLGRAPFDNRSPAELVLIERQLFERFKDRALPFLDFLPRDDWEWLATAQHFGLPTRLLDWSSNPLVAAFFAVCDEAKTDSAIYVAQVDVSSERFDFPPPFEITKPSFYRPTHLNRRIIAQQGLFCILPPPYRLGESQDPSAKIVIPNSLRKILKQHLFQYGVHASSLFPDLDGLARQLTWEHSLIY